MAYNEIIHADAANDYTADSDQYKVMGMDGDVAGTVAAAAGILQNKPKSGEEASVAYLGMSKYRAGGAVSQGDELTVASSGWITSASSGDRTVGRARFAASSGAVGRGVFNFAAPGYLNS
jgi:hypothetical protein